MIAAWVTGAAYLVLAVASDVLLDIRGALEWVIFAGLLVIVVVAVVLVRRKGPPHGCLMVWTGNGDIGRLHMRSTNRQNQGAPFSARALRGVRLPSPGSRPA